MIFEWERIQKSHRKNVGGSNTHRAAVIGGWIVSNDIYTDVLKLGNERCVATSMVFIPDPDHLWQIDVE